MVKGMDEIHVENTLYSWIEDGKPIVALTLEMRRESIRVEFTKAVANVKPFWWSLYS